jgi:hydrogenase maturation protease
MNVSTPFSCTPPPAIDPGRAAIGVVGIGNTLMGDDGAGIAVAEKLRSLLSRRSDLFFHPLRHDLFEIADLLDRARRFIFIDVYLGTPAGTLSRFGEHDAPLPPSLHQVDIATVMRMLGPLGLVTPFPPWEVYGIAVEPPFTLGSVLSPPVANAVDRCAETLGRELVYP